MIATWAARTLARWNVHYGWLMVGLLFVYGVFSTAAMSIPGVLLVPISQDLGWSIGELSGPLGLRVALFGLIAPFAGGLILLYGPRHMLTFSAILLMAGYGLTLVMSEKWQLWLALGVILGIAPGLTALVMGTTVATRWFTARRGLVLGLLSAGSATGQSDLPIASRLDSAGIRLALGTCALHWLDRGHGPAVRDAVARPSS